ncbi:hypothetical protein CWI38_0065p0050 [Hamiltosporidium tvaerminnensis]|uniref:Uncharacterized protein n=1 Tax=Hamiltosporidium tvaerminnensis TaxID=1176355 RepID=A0A4V2JYB5_9MICR|nr:hypothetical protein CWI38_2666p0020 [Hamiltosporidium tvaerminnensis]TBU20473.1 hypothetical protein CWI38_0065p0050 [Hamiltosporidium tvaerminnensis]
MNKNTKIEKLKDEIITYPIIKKIPLVISYFLEELSCKIIPKKIINNLSVFKGLFIIGVTFFSVNILPVLYIYKHDKNRIEDTPLSFIRNLNLMKK